MLFSQPIFVAKPILPDLLEFTNSLSEVWASHKLTNSGPKLKQLEFRLQSVLKANNVSLFNNGTIALMIACKALKLQGEVITTPFTFPATTHALAWCGITPVFCDIDSATLNIDSSKIESLITTKTTAILGVHVFGIPCAVNTIQEIADRHGLKVIYDAAHAFGVEMGGQGIGTFGDVSMFSFHATKLFHTAEGGALTFNDAAIKERIGLLRNFGIKSEEEVVLAGINGKMNEIQAALGLLLLDCITTEKEQRQRVGRCYREILRSCEGITIVTVFPTADFEPSSQYFVIRVDADKYGMSRDQLFVRLRNENIYARKYFYPLCSNLDCYRDLPSSVPYLLPVANRVADDVLVLPFYGELTDIDVRKICSVIVK